MLNASCCPLPMKLAMPQTQSIAPTQLTAQQLHDCLTPRLTCADITLVVSAASIRVQAAVAPPVETNASSIAATLTTVTSSPAEAAAALGVAVSSVSPVTIVEISDALPRPPPSAVRLPVSPSYSPLMPPHPSWLPLQSPTCLDLAPIPLVARDNACAPTVGTLKRADPEPGYVLYSPRTTTDVYLIQTTSGEVVHRWRTPYSTGHGVYLTAVGDIIRLEEDSTPGGYAENATISIPGDASIISVYDWDGRALFRKAINNATHRVHHQLSVNDFDIRNGTGTLFALTAYRLECWQAIALGREECDEAAGMYVEAVLEIDTEGRVVWEWYMSNHLCRGTSCAGNSRKVDINSGFGRDKADWVHANSLAYDSTHDILLLGGAYTSEVYVIDHSAPSEAPLMVNGSGSLLYRFGSDRFGEQHDVSVISCEAAICFTVFNNGRYRDRPACRFDANGTQATDCQSEVLLVTLPIAVLTGPVPLAAIHVQTLFDARTVPSLLDGDSGSFLQICDRSGMCQEQRIFFSLILASAQLIGSPFTPGSYLTVNLGTSGTYFEVAFVSTSGTYSDVRFVHQNFAEIVSAQQPPAVVEQCTLPALVSLSRTSNSGWSTSVFHTRRYPLSFLTACPSPSPPPLSPGLQTFPPLPSLLTPLPLQPQPPVWSPSLSPSLVPSPTPSLPSRTVPPPSWPLPLQPSPLSPPLLPRLAEFPASPAHPRGPSAPLGTPSPMDGSTDGDTSGGDTALPDDAAAPSSLTSSSSGGIMAAAVGGAVSHNTSGPALLPLCMRALLVTKLSSCMSICPACR